MKRYVLLLLATLTSFNTASAANVELRGRDLKAAAKGVEISHEVARLSGFLSDMLGQGATGAIPVQVPHKAVELAAPNFMAAFEAYREAAGPRVTEELRREHRSKMVKAMAPNMQGLAKEDLVLLINAADYLNFPELLDATAPRTVEVLSWENLEYFNENLGGVVAPLSQAIVRQKPDAFFPLVFDTPAKVRKFDPTWSFYKFSEDGKLAVAGSQPQQPEAGGHAEHIVELASGRTLLSKANVDDFSISSDGTRVLWDDEVWDIRQKEHISTMQWGENPPLGEMSKDGRLFLAQYGIWSTDTGRMVRSLSPAGQGRARGLSLSHDETAIIVLFRDGTAKVWDVQTGRLLRTIKKAADRFGPHLHVSPFGPIMGTCAGDFPEEYFEEGSHEHKVRVWNWKTGELLGELKKEGVFPSLAPGVPFSPDGKYVLVQGIQDAVGTCGVMFDLSVWDVARKEEKFSLFKSEDIMPTTEFSINGAQIIAMHEKNIFLFDARTGQKLMTFKHPFLTPVEFRPWVRRGERKHQVIADFHRTADGKQLLTGFGNRVYTWEIATPVIKTYLRGSLKLESVLLLMTLYREHLKDPKAAINLQKLAAKTPGVTGKELAASLATFPLEIRKALITRFKIVHRPTALRRRRRGRLSGHRRA